MSPGVLAAGLLLAALLVLAPPAPARLRRSGRVVAGAPAQRRPRRGPRDRRAVHPSSRARVALAATELAALLRSGAAPAVAWSHLPAAPRAGARGRGGADRDGVEAVLSRAARTAADGGDVADSLVTGPCPARAAAALSALAAAWRVAERTGAPTAEVLDRLAAGLRADDRAQDAREAALAAPRATARVLLALPVAGLLLGAVVGADPVHVLAGTSAGRLCGAGGLACTAAAWAWTRALVRTAEHAR